MDKNKIARVVADKRCGIDPAAGNVDRQRETSQVWQVVHNSAQAALDLAIPDGYVVVPVEPTDAMCRTLTSYPHQFGGREIYKAMLQAAKGDE